MEHQQFGGYCKDCHGPCDHAAGDTSWQPVQGPTKWVFNAIFACGAVVIIATVVALLIWGSRL